MNRYILFSLLALAISSCSVLSGGGKEKDQYVQISTTMGDIVVRLYNETPQHRDNFLKLVNEQFYDSLLFHRVINKFMIQGGDPDSRAAKPGQQLGQGGNGYTIPAEINDQFFHKKGALAAARQADQVNPKRESSGCQFYIVHGKTFSPKELTDMETSKNKALKEKLFQKYLNREDKYELYQRYQKLVKTRDRYGIRDFRKEIDPIIEEQFQEMGGYKFSPEQQAAYTETGGAPHLDGDYTVFGEVIEGLDIIDKIAAVKTQPGDRPVKDIYISAKVIKRK